MITRQQRLPTAIASLALFVALGGTSYAVAKLPRNSVGSAQVVNGSLKARDLAAGVIPDVQAGPRGPRGAEGPVGPLGPVGPQGAQGPQGISHAYVDRNAAVGGLPLVPSENLSEFSRRLTIGTLRLPAGAYRLDFETHAWTSGAARHVDCAIVVGSTWLTKAATMIGAGGGGSEEASLVLSDLATFTAATTVAVVCSQRETGGQINLDDSRFIAMRVGAIEEQ